MSNLPTQDGWPQWSGRIHSDLDRLNTNFSQVTSEILKIQLRLEGFQFDRVLQDLELVAGKLAQLDAKLILLDDKLSGETGLIKKSQDFENRIRTLESQYNKNMGRNTVVAAIVTMILSAAISAFISSFERDKTADKNTPAISDN